MRYLLEFAQIYGPLLLLFTCLILIRNKFKHRLNNQLPNGGDVFNESPLGKTRRIFVAILIALLSYTIFNLSNWNVSSLSDNQLAFLAVFVSVLIAIFYTLYISQRR
jgi:hypothetical protein